VSATGTIFVRRPTVDPREEQSAPTYTVDRALPGLYVGFRTDPAWRSWTRIAGVWEEYLRRDGARSLSVEKCSETTGTDGGGVIAKLAHETDCAIVGLGTCGSCTAYTVADAVAVESAEKPVVAVVTDEFATHGRNMARVLKHGDLKILALPYPLEGRPDDELDRIAEEYYPVVLDLLGVTS
jgi:hypothetical protein